MSVVHNASRPELVLRKKNNSVCYHAVCASVAIGKTLDRHISSKDNITHLTKKVLYGERRRYLVSNILYNIHADHKSPMFILLELPSSKLDFIGNTINLEGG